MESLTIDINVPNMDCMDVDELTEIETYFYGIQKLAELVREYAIHQKLAMQHRAAGRIHLAQCHTEKCEEIYKKIPQEYQW